MKEVHYILNMTKEELINLNKMNISWAEPQIKHSHTKEKEVTKTMAEKEFIGNVLTDEEMAKINEIAKTAKERTGNPVSIAVTADVSKEESIDETKGEVSPFDEEFEKVSEDSGLILEQAESGKGFAIYRDYSQDKSGKLKRLVR